MSVIGIVLGVIAIGLFIWFRKDQEMTNDLVDGDFRGVEHSFKALMDNFSNYQVENERKISELEKAIEIKTKNTDRQIMRLTKELPTVVRKVVGHIEFAEPLNKK